MNNGVLLEDLPRIVEAVMRWRGGEDDPEWRELLRLEAGSEEMRTLLDRARTAEWTAADAARLVGLMARDAAEAEASHLREMARSTAEDRDYEEWQVGVLEAVYQGLPRPKPWLKPSVRTRLAKALREKKRLAEKRRKADLAKYDRLMLAKDRTMAEALSAGWPMKKDRDRVRRQVNEREAQKGPPAKRR